jgi:hypothetical protein
MAGPKKRTDCTVDFSGVESGGRAVPDGEYLLEVSSIEEKESSEGNAYLAWKWKVADGAYKGATIYDNTSLKSTALWRLKTLLECLGVDVTNGKMALNFKDYIGKTCLVMVANETYQGKQKPRIGEFLRGLPTSSSGSKSSSPFKKGQGVTFDYEGEKMSGQVVSIDGDTVVVSVDLVGEAEEWELSVSELSAA